MSKKKDITVVELKDKQENNFDSYAVSIVRQKGTKYVLVKIPLNKESLYTGHLEAKVVELQYDAVDQAKILMGQLFEELADE